MFDYLVRACTEAAGGTQRTGKGANDDVDLGWVNVLVLCDTPSTSAKNTKRRCFI